MTEPVHNSQPSGDELVQLLDRQCRLYALLGDLAREQGEIVADGQPEDLLSLLARRQRIINEISGINTQLEPYRGQPGRLAAMLTPAQRQAVTSHMERISAWRDQIVRQDELDSVRLRQRQQTCGTELSRIVHTGAAARAYQSNQATRSRLA